MFDVRDQSKENSKESSKATEEKIARLKEILEKNKAKREKKESLLKEEQLREASLREMTLEEIFSESDLLSGAPSEDLKETILKKPLTPVSPLDGDSFAMDFALHFPARKKKRKIKEENELVDDQDVVVEKSLIETSDGTKENGLAQVESKNTEKSTANVNSSIGMSSVGKKGIVEVKDISKEKSVDMIFFSNDEIVVNEQILNEVLTEGKITSKKQPRNNKNTDKKNSAATNKTDKNNSSTSGSKGKKSSSSNKSIEKKDSSTSKTTGKKDSSTSKASEKKDSSTSKIAGKKNSQTSKNAEKKEPILKENVSKSSYSKEKSNNGKGKRKKRRSPRIVIAAVVIIAISVLSYYFISNSRTDHIYNVNTTGEPAGKGLPHFITDEMMVALFETQTEFGIPVSTGISMIIAEGGFGNFGPGGAEGSGLSRLSYQYNNLFGIKYWEGMEYATGSVNMNTWEHTSAGDVYYYDSGFAVFESYRDAILKRAWMLMRSPYFEQVEAYLNPRDGTFTEEQANSFMYGIRAGGWATDLDYVEKNIHHMQFFDLYRFDNMSFQEFWERR